MERILIALDVETTGLEAGVDELIEVAAVKFRGAEILETFSQLVRPRQSVPLKISRLTGISVAMLADAPRFPDVAAELARFLGSHPIVGHSVGFDARMLQAQGMRLPQPLYDTHELATMLLPGLPAYSLVALAQHLGVPLAQAHRALDDADATRQLFLRLVERIAAIELRELGELNRALQRTEWPIREVFADVERQRMRDAFGAVPPAPTVTLPAIGSPLKPTGDATPIDPAQVRQFFAHDGAMGLHFDAYEQRAEQATMAAAVARTLADGGALLVEAGTGTGKGMAYLVPAMLHALRRGERVVVSTNTINLQDQLFFKDIPALQRISGERFDAALLKGRGNYLCLHRYRQLRRDSRVDPDTLRMLLKVQLWLPQTTRGDRAELSLHDREAGAWQQVSAAFDMCAGPRCADFDQCWFFRARRQAEAAHLVVVNHALMLADAQTESEVIPAYDHLVIDEAHNLEDVATDQFGFTIDRERLTAFLDDLYVEGGSRVVAGLLSELPRQLRESDADQATIERIEQIAERIRPALAPAHTAVFDCFNQLRAYLDERQAQGAHDPRLRLTDALRREPAWAGVLQAWDNLTVLLGVIHDALGRLATQLGELKRAEILEYEQLVLRVAALQRFTLEARVKIGHIIMGGDEALITWLSHDRLRDTLVLAAAPLEVGPLLHANLFTRRSTVVLTSATLTIGASFSYVADRLQVPEPTTLMLESPFDYARQALVYLPSDMPEPNHPGYQRALESTIIEVARASGGRMLVLFTSNHALRQTYQAVQAPLEASTITVLGQGIDGSRRSVLDRFKTQPRTVLFGTTSFWEGVDVVGDALSVLVIARLPFSVPSDPVVAARAEGFADAFNDYQVPQSILRFKQGFGRLVRSRGDRGVVLVLDRRILSKRYGQLFLDSLPPTNVRSGALRQAAALSARFLASEGLPTG
jgi:DNA polymerase-3 subunit epsilon/ATP-dependent DNA helicase DinG